MKFLLILFWCVGLSAQTISIASSANLAFVMPHLVASFNQTNPNIKVRYNIASSGKLYAQITHGASYDIFMSANEIYADKLHKTDKSYSLPVIYAKGRLALISTKQQPTNIDISHLTHKNIDKIAIGNPATAPYGVATKQALTNAKIYDKIKHKFVYGESISQTLSYVINSTNIGIVALSSLYSKKLQHLKKGTHYIEIDSELYDPIKQGMLRLNNKQETRLFFEFLVSTKAKQIFARYGY